VPARDAGLGVKLVYVLMRRSFRQLTGRDSEGMLGPIGMYAHIPKLLFGYGTLELAVANLHRVDKRLRALAELKAVTLTYCEWRIDQELFAKLREHLDEAQLVELTFGSRLRTCAHAFSPAPRPAACGT
jgi:alkylhydroperoxidase family enzyme